MDMNLSRRFLQAHHEQQTVGPYGCRRLVLPFLDPDKSGRQAEDAPPANRPYVRQVTTELRDRAGRYLVIDTIEIHQAG